MTPHLEPVGLEALFEQVDGWFADFTAHEPISHYARVRKKPSPATKSTSQQANRSKPTLDSLAKDLELLLEDNFSDETNEIPPATRAEPEIFHFNICNNDELALLDKSIGSCYVTYGEIKDDHAMDDWTGACNVKEFSVVLHDGNDNQTENDSSKSNIDNNRENNDLKVQTSMPLDHDYLPKPRAKSSSVDSQYLSNIRSKQKDISVLHAGVIKRFARFSSKFRELSLRNDRSLIAINNGS